MGATVSRAGYSSDYEGLWREIMYRGAVKSAIRGKRGQAFLRETIATLDALQEPRLIAGNLMDESGVCALGAVGAARGLDLLTVYPEGYDVIAEALGIAESLAREIEYVNDEDAHYGETPERRFERVREWVAAQIDQEEKP